MRPGRRVLTITAAISLATTSACAPDPPSAVVGVVVVSCDPGVENGSGMVIAPGLALTSAHVLAGAREITVTSRDRDGERRTDGTIVAFDPEMDLAYVAFAEFPVRPLEVGSAHLDPDDHGMAYVVRHGEVVEVPVRVTRRVQINTEDIYVQGETTRPGFELAAAIEPGDSGGAVVIDGLVAGVLWARSNRFPGRAYAIDAVRASDRIDRQLASGELGDDVDLARCH